MQSTLLPGGLAVPRFLDSNIRTFYETWNTYNNGRPLIKGRHPIRLNDIRVDGNDYLRLAIHPEIVAAQKHALEAFGTGPNMSGIFMYDEVSPYKVLERKMARFLGTEDVTVCQTGFNANLGLIQAFAPPDVPVYIDHLAHGSLWAGVKLVGSRPRPFRHNDPEHLRRLIKKHGPGLVAVDSIYSVTGTVCPLSDIVRIAESNDCVLIVDESHSLGLIGSEGKGLVNALGLTGRIHFITASLAKAFASIGGVVAGPTRLIEMYRYTALGAIFSSVLEPHTATRFQKTLEIIRRDEWRRVRVRENASRLRAGLTELGFDISGSESQIISLNAGATHNAIELRDALESRGIFGAMFFPPAVPTGGTVVRFTVHCELTHQDIHRILLVCEELKGLAGFSKWPSNQIKKGSRRERGSRQVSKPQQ